MKQDGRKVSTFIAGDRRVHYVEIPDDEVDEYLEGLRQQMEKLNAEHNAKPGFIK